MGKVKQGGVGIGVTNATNAGTNPGTGDDAFTGYTDTPNWNTTIGGWGVSNSAEQDRVYWSHTALTTWTHSFEIYFDALLTPSGAKPIFRNDSNAGATAICYLGVDTAGKLQFRNSSNVATLTAPSGPSTATWYRVVFVGSTASSAGTMWVGTPGADPTTSTNMMTGSNGATAVTFGVTTQPNYASYGKQDGTALNAVFRIKNQYIGNTNADPGTYPWPPDKPTSVGHGTATDTTMPLTWTAPTNIPNASLASYKVYKDGVYVSASGGTTGTSYTVTGLTSSTSYSWTVSAVDSNGNEGFQSAAHAASTTATGLTTTSTLAGTGSITASGGVQVLGTSTLAGTGTLTATGSVAKLTTSTLTGTGTITATGGVAASTTATLAGTGAITAGGVVGVVGSATLAGTGTISTAAATPVTGTATLAGTGAISAAGVVGKVSTSTLAGTGTITASLGLSVTGTATRTGTGSIVATGVVGLSGSSTLAGTGALGTTNTSGFTTYSTLTGLGDILPDGLVGVFADGVLTGIGTISSTGNLTYLQESEIAGLGLIVASGIVRHADRDITVSATGPYYTVFGITLEDAEMVISGPFTDTIDLYGPLGE
jgi:hypothetical protein